MDLRYRWMGKDHAHNELVDGSKHYPDPLVWRAHGDGWHPDDRRDCCIQCLYSHAGWTRATIDGSCQCGRGGSGRSTTRIWSVGYPACHRIFSWCCEAREIARRSRISRCSAEISGWENCLIKRNQPTGRTEPHRRIDRPHRFWENIFRESHPALLWRHGGRGASRRGRCTWDGSGFAAEADRHCAADFAVVLRYY